MFRRAFTLTELLVVIALMSALAAVLYPVMARAKSSARQTVCASRFRQVAAATLHYGGDYDERWVTPVQDPARTDGRDRNWVRLVMPYARSFRTFRCPEDPHGPDVDVSYSNELVSTEVDARYAHASQRVETGFNFQNLSPVLLEGSRFVPSPRGLSEASPETLLFVETAWHVDERGRPSGGGSALVEPPCRYAEAPGGRRDTFDAGRAEVYSLSRGWFSAPETGMPYGGAFGWHSGRTMTAMVDGHVRSLSVSALSRGCEPKAAWSGLITDPAAYVWER